MVKRYWLMLIAALALGLFISACVGGDLAEDLTPIPTLPPGEEPAPADTGGDLAAQPTSEGGVPMDEAQLVALGETLFVECRACHAETDGTGPAFAGMAERAATRVEQLSAVEYLHQSIVEPDAFVVEGYQNIMPGKYAELPETEIDALIAYIMAEPGGEVAATPEPTEEAGPTEEPTEEATPEATEAPTEEAEAATGDPEAGAEVFAARGCAACHGESDGAGPALPGIGERAETRVEGLPAAEYLHQSIVDPSAHIVEPFNDIMPKTYGEDLSEDEINDLVAYLLAQ